MLLNVGKCATVQLVVLSCIAVGAAAVHFTTATEQREMIDKFLASKTKQASPVDTGAAANDPPSSAGSPGAAASDPRPPESATTPPNGNGSTQPATDTAGSETPPAQDPNAPFNIDALEPMISVEQAVRLYNLSYEDPAAPQVIFLDAREADKYAQAHIPMAYHVTPQSFFDGTLPEDLEYWAKDSIIVVYCSGGDCDASHLVETRLRQQKSFTRVFIMGDGLPGWQALGLPTEAGGP